MVGRRTCVPAVALLASVVVGGCGKGGVAAQTDAPNSRKVELTVYKDDFAMVRESRPVSLDAGANRLQIDLISSKLDPSSVLFSWPTPDTASVVSNTYDLGMPSGRALLRRYVGQDVDLVRYGQDGKPGEKLTGTLEVASDNSVVLKSNGKYIVDPEGTVVAPNRSDIVAMSQLSVGVQSPSKQTSSLGMAYLTGGLGWSADYVAKLDPHDDSMSLECWATITNHTGIAFPQSKLTLMAGSPNRAVVETTADSAGYSNGVVMAKPLTELERRGTATFGAVLPTVSGELYAYPIDLPATIAPEEMNRVRMLSSARVPVQKDYSVRISGVGFDSRPVRQNATLTINFTNSVESKLGVPLPQGTVRAYEPDSAGAAQYVGAANVGDTPKDQLVSLTLSNVFDVTSQSKLVRVARLDKRHVRQDFMVTLSNQKDVPVKLRVVHGFYGDFSVVKESESSKRLNAGERQWTVTIPSHGHVELSYSVRVGG